MSCRGQCAPASADLSSGAYTIPSSWLRERISGARHDRSFSAVAFFLGARISVPVFPSIGDG